MGYPQAEGHMMEVWATGECPVCSNDMDQLCDDYETDGNVSLHFDTYTCKHCRIMVTYVSPDQYTEYHQVPDVAKLYFIDKG